MRYMLDTNIVTAILKGNVAVEMRLRELIIEGKDVRINGISYYEIKRGLLAAKARAQLGRFDTLCRSLGLLLLDVQNIFDEASQIWSNLKQGGELLEDADILIASVAKIRDCILVSDDSDFERIAGLKRENWLT